MNVLKNNKFIKMWLGMSLAIRTSIAIMIASFFQSGMKLLFVPIFTRLLNTSEYGVVTVFESIQTTLGTLTMLSLSASCYSRGMQEFKEDRDRFTSSLLLLSNLCTLTVGVIFIAMHRQMSSLLKLSELLIGVMFINFIFMPAYNFWIARQRFEYRYRSMLIVTILINIFSPIFGVLMIYVYHGDKSLAKIIGSEIVLMFAYVVLYFITFHKSRFKVKRSYIRYGLHFNLPLIPHYASQQILSSCDRIMIQSIIDSSSAGIYGLSYQVATVVRIIWTSINTVLVPWEYDKIESGKIDSIKRLTRTLIICYGVICVGIMFIAPEVIRLFAPSSYHEGIYVIAPVIAGVFFTGLYSMLAILEFYYKKNFYVMIASSIAALLNILLNWIFIPIFGYKAAAYTTLFCYVVYAMLHAYNLKRLKLDHYYDMKAIYILSAFMIVISILVAQTYDGFLLRYALLLVILIVAFIQRKLLMDTLSSLKRKKKE